MNKLLLCKFYGRDIISFQKNLVLIPGFDFASCEPVRSIWLQEFDIFDI